MRMRERLLESWLGICDLRRDGFDGAESGCLARAYELFRRPHAQPTLMLSPPSATIHAR
jgi:hypothetical protein